MDSGLSEQEFARSRCGQYMSEQGLLYTPAPGGGFATAAFRFTGTECRSRNTAEQGHKNGTVILSAPPFNGKPLLSFMEDAMGACKEAAAQSAGQTPSEVQNGCREKIAALRALDAVYRAAEYGDTHEAHQTGGAARHGIADTPRNCGPLSVLYADDGSVLFLPPALFERSVLARTGAERAALYGFWVRGGMSGHESRTFTFAACVYAVLTGKPPFTEIDDERRTEDYADNNFIPLACLFPHIADNSEGEALRALIHSVDAALAAPKKNRKGAAFALRGGHGNRHTGGYGTEGGGQAKVHGQRALPSFVITEKAFKKNPFVPLPVPPAVSGNTVPSPADDNSDSPEQQSLALFVRAQQKTVRRRRFMRKHGTKLAFGTGLFAIVLIAAISIIKTNLERPNTKGMTPIEVVHTFYNGLHTLDTIVMDGCGTHKAVKAYSNMAANLFVTGKIRQAYEKSPPFLPPEQWPFSYDPASIWIFGLTRLSIAEMDGKGTVLPTYTHTAYAEKGDSVRIHADFFIIANEGAENYSVMHRNDELTLSFNKRWRITDIQSRNEDIAIDSASFKNDMTAALKAAHKAAHDSAAVHEDNAESSAATVCTPETFSENLIREIAELYGRYPWLPDEASLRRGFTEIFEYYRFR